MLDCLSSVFLLPEGWGWGGGSKICSPNHILSFGNLKNLTNLTGSTMSEGHMQKQIRFLKSAGKL